MAPIEDLQSRDLAWISDFVMQQMVIMLRPMMDHLQETDASCDYAQRMVQRLSMDVAEVRGDVERTNKYLAILRQGMGVQNEGKCVLQRSLEGTARSVKRLDDQMESVLSAVRGVEDSIGQMSQEARGEKGRQEDLHKHFQANAQSIEDLQAKVERLTTEAHATKDDLLSNEARMEVLQREVRELRRGSLGVVPKLEEKAGRPPPSSQSCRPSAPEQAPWPEKKKLASYVEPIASGKGSDAGFQAAGGFAETNSNHSGSSQQSKRRVGSGSGAGIRMQPDHLEFGVAPSRSGSRAAVWSSVDGALPTQDCGDDPAALGASLGSAGPGDEAPGGGGRLPLLAAGGRPGPRPTDRGATDPGPRLRFHATMAKPESRGSPRC